MRLGAEVRVSAGRRGQGEGEEPRVVLPWKRAAVFLSPACTPLRPHGAALLTLRQGMEVAPESVEHKRVNQHLPGPPSRILRVPWASFLVCCAVNADPSSGDCWSPLVSTVELRTV